jgi:hypothetical protein
LRAGVLSPVSNDSSTSSAVACTRRRSAGTRLPEASTTRSPGTRSVEATSCSTPSRTTVDRGAASSISARTDRSALRSCVVPIAALIASTAAMTAASVRWSIARVTTKATSRMAMSGLVN